MKTLKWTVLAALAVLLTAGSASAADWELWADKTQMPPDGQMVGLPVVPSGENIVLATETDSSWVMIDVHQTLEKDGKQYKALQLFQDSQLTATVPVGKWLIGLIGTFFPTGTADVMGCAASTNMVSVEIDGTTIPIDSSYLFGPGPMVGPDAASWAGWEGGAYVVFPRFNTPATHTFVQKWRPQVFYYVEPYEAEGLVDPSPEFEGRRVLVPEQVGNPVDGEVVFKYTLTVVEEPTAVPSWTWGQVKDAQE